MRYRVTFRRRFNELAEPLNDPESLLDPGDGVVVEQEFLETVEPAGLGVAEDLNDGAGSQASNDNGFLAFGTETWVYEVAEGREKEFLDALAESQVVLDYEELPDESLTT